MKKLTALTIMVALFSTTLVVTSAQEKKASPNSEKVNFSFKLNDNVGSNAEQWERAFEESAQKSGFEVVDRDTEDSIKVNVIIGKDDADDDNDGKEDTADTDQYGDGVTDTTQSIDEVNLDKEVPQLLEEGTDKNKSEGVYLEVEGENGHATLFKSQVDDFNFQDDASAIVLSNGGFLQNASFSPSMGHNSASAPFPVFLALRIGFQVAKIGYQVYKIAKKK